MPRFGSAPPCDQIPGASGAFGYDPTNPVPGDANWYCPRLRCPDGHPYRYHRAGSTGAGPDGHIMDLMELRCAGGESNIVLYFDMYHAGASSLVPEGLSLSAKPLGYGTTRGIDSKFSDGW